MPKRLKPHERLHRAVNVLVSEDEYYRIQDHASDEGMSSWCREAIRSVLFGPLPIDPTDRILREDILPKREKCIMVLLNDVDYLALLHKAGVMYSLSEYCRAIVNNQYEADLVRLVRLSEA